LDGEVEAADEAAVEAGAAARLSPTSTVARRAACATGPTAGFDVLPRGLRVGEALEGLCAQGFKYEIPKKKAPAI
jgi:hypothetical protein